MWLVEIHASRPIGQSPREVERANAHLTLIWAHRLRLRALLQLSSRLLQTQMRAMHRACWVLAAILVAGAVRAQAPTLVTLTPGDRSVTLGFAPASAADDVQEYLASCSPTPDPGTVLEAALPARSGAAAARQVTVAGLENGGEYVCWVQAITLDAGFLLPRSRRSPPSARTPPFVPGAGGTVFLSRAAAPAEPAQLAAAVEGEIEAPADPPTPAPVAEAPLPPLEAELPKVEAAAAPAAAPVVTPQAALLEPGAPALADAEAPPPPYPRAIMDAWAWSLVAVCAAMVALPTAVFAVQGCRSRRRRSRAARAIGAVSKRGTPTYDIGASAAASG